MLCENCHKKQAVVHLMMMVNDKPSDKWLCEDCASELLPPGMGNQGSNLSPEKALKFLKHLLGEGANELFKQQPKRAAKDGFSMGAAKVLELAANKALDCGSEHIGSEHILAGFLAHKDCIGTRIINHLCSTDLHDIEQELENWLDKSSRKGTGVPKYSQRAL